MIIEIHQPEIEALIEQRMATGQFESIEDLLLQSLEATPAQPQADETASPASKPSLSQFLMESPLWKSGLVVERIKDLPRPVDL